MTDRDMELLIRVKDELTSWLSDDVAEKIIMNIEENVEKFPLEGDGKN